MTSREIDWSQVKRALVVKLRSIGDTVLATPSLIALKRFLPNAEVDILLEDWVAPVLDAFDRVDHVIPTGNDLPSRLKTAMEIRRRRYDVVFNLHGGTTSTLFVMAARAPHRIGYANYRWAYIYNHLLASPQAFWVKLDNHSAEQQLALPGFVGVPVDDRPKSRLVVSDSAMSSLELKFRDEAETSISEFGSYALVHPTAAFATKQWPVENFAQAVEFLAAHGVRTIAVASKNESAVLDTLRSTTDLNVVTFDSLTLPEITALASNAQLFVGNDSGIAHIAAAVNTPSVVIFGSSNRVHWHPWTDAPNEIVFESFPCQPCPGFECKEFGDAPCIRTVPVRSVTDAIDRVLAQKEANSKARL
jgi:lipopolysaccharide heptosyltransferase II